MVDFIQPVRIEEPPEDRLSQLSEASLRINESLDPDRALRTVMNGARSLTDAPYSVITTLDSSGEVEDHRALGLEPGDVDRLWQVPEAAKFYEYLAALEEPLRIGPLHDFTRSIGLADFRLPVSITAFMSAPILLRGARMGNIYVGSDEPGREFTREDEETLVLFASQAAQVIANARRHRDEQRARAGLETLIDTSPVGVVVFDAVTGVLTSVNRETRRIADKLRHPDQTLDDLLGLMTVRRADGQEVSLREFPLAQVLVTSDTVRAEEIVMGMPDGRSVTVLLNATPIRSEEGDVESVVVTIQDLTPLEEQERLRAEFLGMVSHELRMPLTSIRGAASALLEATADLDPAEMRQFHRIIVDQADNMRELIGDLLDVARIETGTLPVDPQPADAVVLVDRARNVFQSTGGRNDLDIDVGNDLPKVMADRRRIVQVIGNLLSNAARHSPELSAIKVSVEHTGVHVEVSVADEGRGIPAEALPRLFRKFYHQEGPDTGGDTGLGLAICKGIVEAHGGRIWAESDGPGLGARFVFTLPVADDTEPASPAARSHDDAPPGGTVLVVDDDPLTLRSVRDALSPAGFRPVVTADPDDALLLVEKERPNLVLLDLMLPGHDGVELMRDILSVSEVPVIFLSAYGKDVVVARILEEGATDYIVKPFSPTELVARVKAALRRFVRWEHPESIEPFVLGDLTIDYAQRTATVAGRPAQLTPIEYHLLVELAAYAGRVVPHEQLLRRAWSPKKPGNLQVLRTHLMRLRHKLGDDAGNPKYIFSVPRVGYRMPETTAEPDKT